MAELSSQQFVRYSRQLMLDGWDDATQLRLTKSHVAIIGAGGLANIAASYLAGAGVGTLSIIDGDEVELSNLPRQIAFDLDSLENAKVYELANRLQEQNDQLSVNAHLEYLEQSNALNLLEGVDLVLDCCDNMATRYLVNRTCLQLKLPLISASVAKWQGQLLMIDPQQPQHGCYQCLFPEAPPGNSSCRTLGVAGPMVGVLGSFQASEALRYLIGEISQIRQKVFCIDGATLTTNSFARTKNAQCVACADRLNLKE